MCVCRGQRLISGVIPRGFLRQGLIGLELVDYASLSGQQASSVPPVQTLIAMLAFSHGFWGLDSGSCAHVASALSTGPSTQPEAGSSKLDFARWYTISHTSLSLFLLL